MSHPASSRFDRPFHTFIFKLFSRCNLNCTYCYMYNLADRSYQRQPWGMSPDIVQASIRRIREHLDAHGKRSAHFVLHGGEPLLGGSRYLSDLFQMIDEVLDPSVYSVKIGIQSNGILFDPEIGDLLLARAATIGISLDGPPAVNDLHRIDHGGRGSSSRVERALAILRSARYHKVFAGFLVVIDIAADPLGVYRYLAGFAPPSIDFLLPYDNYVRRPKGKDILENTVYADWLLTIFDTWWREKSTIRVREFDNIIRMVLGGRSTVESLGLEPADIIVFETNGDIELVDSLKGTFEGATHLGFNVQDTPLDHVAQHNMVEFRRQGLDSLSDKCQSCTLVGVCGGGYLPNRFAAESGFRNPSVYCYDLQKLIMTIRSAVKAAVPAKGGDNIVERLPVPSN